jgi:hypothetical protein
MTSLCKDNCGFYGNQHYNGYCSICIQKYMVTEISTLQEESKMEMKCETTVQQNRSRCKKCTKKIGLLGHECECSFIFCSKCRHAEEHNCTVNFSEKGKEELRKKNPIIQTDKIVYMD